MNNLAVKFLTSGTGTAARCSAACIPTMFQAAHLYLHRFETVGERRQSWGRSRDNLPHHRQGADADESM